MYKERKKCKDNVHVRPKYDKIADIATMGQFLLFAPSTTVRVCGVCVEY